MSGQWLEAVKAQGKEAQIGVLVLPGQVPGPRSLEHETRMQFGLDVWTRCVTYSDAYLITTANCRDRYGKTSAEYMHEQFAAMANLRSRRKFEGWNRTITGEDKSFHTASSFRHLQKHFEKIHYDLIVMVSNGLHLWVASVYWKHILPGMPMVTASSGSGSGSAGGRKSQYGLLRYALREAVHYGAAMSIDWALSGTLLDRLGYSDRFASYCREHEWPPLPITD